MSIASAVLVRRQPPASFPAARPQLRMPRIALCALLTLLAREVRSEGVRIHEFVALNADSLIDEDGDASDWIELYNGGDADVDLAGWSLTDDAGTLSKWVFPAVKLAAGRYLVVFASGKDRRDPESELHTNFRLDGDGEYLALVEPDGSAVAQEFAPAFPPQREDVAFGVGVEVLEPRFVRIGAAATILVPTDDTLGRDWTGGVEPFDDGPEAGWTPVTVGLGYDSAPDDEEEGGPPELIGYWAFDDFEDGELALDSSGHDRHGNITSQFALAGAGRTARPRYSPDGSGHTGLAGDRALDFGATGNGALVEVPSALLGAFDAATANDAISIALWIFGSSEQPANGSVFWGSSDASGGGIRSLNAHVPWSDGTIYWDTGGCCDGTQRISRSGGESRLWRGEWNHYVFVKDGDRKQIWQNGSLLHEGTNTADLTTVRNFTIGGSQANGLSYGGMIDDFAVWAAALDEQYIQGLARGASPLDLTRFAPLIETDVRDRMLDRGTTIYVRLRFELDPADTLDSVVLRVRYDDGFIAYLNGEEVARRNAPDLPRFDSRALSDRPRSAALEPHDIDLAAHAHVLRPGANVLAIHALNDSVSSGDFLIVPELLGVRRRADRYLSPPTPGVANAAGALGFVADTRFSVEHGYFVEPFSVEITCETADARIYYTTDGSSPGPDTPGARLYSTPVLVEGTTTLRARAFKDGEGFRLVGGVRYDFEAHTLDPGGVVVIVKDRAAFASRYGMERNVEGEYSGSLSNSGELLRILGPLGERLHELEYSDAWYPATDGQGYSLSIVDPTAAPETWREPASWRRSDERHGSPGVVPTRADGRQVPGDLNQDASLDVTDVLRALGVLFGGDAVPLPCDGTIDHDGNRALLDVNGDGGFNLTDPLHLLNYLFLGGVPPSLGTECVRLEGCADRCR